MKVDISERSRHLVVRAHAGELFPDSFIRVLQDQSVNCGWFRASGVLTEVELRAFRAELGQHAPVRRIAGPVQAVSVEGGIGIAGGDLTISMRAVIARETDRGLETISGELVSARVVAVEALVVALDDLRLSRSVDPHAGVWLFGDAPSNSSASSSASKDSAVSHTSNTSQARAVATPASPPSAWADAISASVDADSRTSPGRSNTAGGPPRPVARGGARGSDDTELPEAGDVVEHFHFGRCDVFKSDGDRLHLKVHKDGRIKEIALEMLKVTPLSNDGTRKRFRLDRKI